MSTALVKSELPSLVSDSFNPFDITKEQRFERLIARMNRTIAEAVGGFKAKYFNEDVIDERHGVIYNCYFIPCVHKGMQKAFPISPFNMRFHRNWNWVMSAVDYIHKENHYLVDIFKRRCVIVNMFEERATWTVTSEESSIDAVFKAVYLWAEDKRVRREVGDVY